MSNNLDYEGKFKENIKKYDELGLNIKSNLKTLLEETDIDFMDIEYRVKSFESFKEKIKRKNPENPFKEIEDICGIRIICYYVNDLKKIDEIINKNFKIISKEYKEKELEKNQFGYRSNHYIVELDPNWCVVPTLTKLKNLKAEIQVRTILMHAWADISHQLSYKQDSNKDFERKLNQISALFEIADSHFVGLKELKLKKINKDLENKDKYDHLLFTEDLLGEIIKKYVPTNREHNGNIIENSKLIEQIIIESFNKYNITPKMLIEYLKIVDKKDISKLEKITWPNANNKASAIGYIRLVVSIFNDEYSKKEPYFLKAKESQIFLDLIKKYRR